MASKRRIVGIFVSMLDLLKAIRVVRQSGFDIYRVHSPFPSEEIQEALGSRKSFIRVFALAGGIGGALAAYVSCAFFSLTWNFDVWGKPVLAWIPFSVIGYEWTILWAVIFIFWGLVIRTRMHAQYKVRFYDPRFTDDHFGLSLFCSEGEMEKASNLLREAGAKEIRAIEE